MSLLSPFGLKVLVWSLWYINDLQSQLVHKPQGISPPGLCRNPQNLRDTGGESGLCSVCEVLLPSAG